MNSPLKVNSLRNNTISSITFSFKYVSKSKLLPKIVRFVNKYLYRIPIFGIGAVLDRYTDNLTIYSASEDKKKYLNYKKKAIFANFGSGSFSHNRWTNFDYPGLSTYYKAIQGEAYKDFIPIDLTEKNLKIPFKDSSVDLIYLSHVFEHLNYDAGVKLFQEFHRVLDDKGIIRIVIPFGDRLVYCSSIIDMQDNIEEELKEISNFAAIKEIYADSIKLTPNDLLNISRKCNFDIQKIEEILKNKCKNLFKFDSNDPGRHIVYWNELKLIKLIKETGFNRIYPLLKGHTFAKPFENISLFDNTEPHISIYFEIKK